MPRLLDLFCCAGGCSTGYARAGFEVVGVDLEPQPRYPFTFHQADALSFPLDGFDAIHASPPCQDYSRALRHLASPQPRLIDQIRSRLITAGVPWIIENVMGAPLPSQSDLFGAHGTMLCGSMFGLAVYRHRLFEASFALRSPGPCVHDDLAMNPHNQRGRDRIKADHAGDPEKAWRLEMGVSWMNKHEGREAIPPVYTEYLGMQLVDACECS